MKKSKKNLVSENNKGLQKRKGRTNNPNGRPKGVPNKVTADLREWIKQIIENNKAQFEIDLRSVEPQQRLAILEKLLSYVVPKLANVEQKINVDYSQLSEEALNTIINELKQSIEND